MKKFWKSLGHQGFTIVEIMVALTLVVLVFSLIPSDSADEQHSQLEESIEEFDRAIRFGVNESILRNSIVRLNINLDASPNEYTVEFGPSGNLVLPNVVDTEDLNLAQREAQEKKMKDINSQFSKVQEFSDSPKKLPEAVMVIGVANPNYPKIIKSGSAFIYFYPTGEKDSGIIFFSTEQELGTLEIPAFENNTRANYLIYSQADLVNLGDTQDNKMKDYYEDWQKN